MVSSSSSVTAVVFLRGQVADVFVVEVDVDEGAQLAFGGEEVLLQLGIAATVSCSSALGDGGAGDVTVSCPPV